MPSRKSTLWLAASIGALAYVVFAAFELRYQVDVGDKLGKRQLKSENEESAETKLNILTLGGSVTWGACMDERKHAYPFRLREDYGHRVTNLAIRGTGSGYPAQCISSMLVSEKNDLSNYDADVPFDVVIFEFSLNGMHGFQLLVQRLRERFPDAFFIYVDMFSLLSPKGAFDSSVARKIVKESGGEVYNFGNSGNATLNYNFREEVKDRSSPTEEIRRLFGNDRHHASPDGHNLVTSKLVEIMKHHTFSSDPKLGSWLGGDTCVSWYGNGKTFLHIDDGGEMKEWDEEKHKFAIEVNQTDGATLQYNHKSDKDAAIGLQYMTKATVQNGTLSSMYPPMVVTIEQDQSAIRKAKTKAMTKALILERENVEQVNKIEEGWKYLSGLHRKAFMRTASYHVTDVSNVGTLKPGRNFIYLYPVERRPYPFRLTSIIICEACARLGWNEDVGVVG